MAANSKEFEFAACSEGDMPGMSQEAGTAELQFPPDLIRKTESMFDGVRIVLAEAKMPAFMIEKLYKQFVDHLRGIPDLYAPPDPVDTCTRYGDEIPVPDNCPWKVEKQDMEILAERAWVEEVKFFLCLPMAKYLKNDPPKSPSSSDGFFPAGNVRRWFKARINAENNQNTHLWYSFLQAKRSCDPFSEAHAQSLFNDHYEALTKEDPYVNYSRDPEACTIIDNILNDDNVKTVIDRVRRELDTDDSLRHLQTRFLSSATNTHACFENKRGSGGKVAHLRNLVDLAPNYWSDHENDSVTTDTLHSMTFANVYKNHKYKHQVVEKRCTTEYESWDSLGLVNLEFLSRPVNPDYEEWVDEFQTGDYDSIRDYRRSHKRPERFLIAPTHEKLKCEVRGVLEPLKCRMISKGEALPYSLCKPIQEALFGILKRMPCFRLIGQKFCPTMLYDLAKDAKPDHEWLSIDYKAATDNLSWYFSMQIMRRLTVNLPKEVVELIIRVLGPHELWYPNPDRDDLENPILYMGDQKNGQLMGSILSFPILCLANLFVYLYANRNEPGSLISKLNRVLVNGDDMLYTGTPKTYLEHARISSAVGLELSVGKAYCHPRYANINSTSVVYDIARIPYDAERFRDWKYRYSRLFGRNVPSPFQINYLNVGLMLNKHKVQGSTDEEEEKMRAGMSRFEIEDEKYKKWLGEPWNKEIRKLRPAQIWEEWRKEVLIQKNLFLSSFKVSQMYAQSHTYEDSRSGITENIPLILEGCRDEKAKIATLKWLLVRYRDEIKRQTTFPFRELNTGKVFLTTRNLFLPFSLGGMGVPPPVGFKFRITQFQLGLVRKLFEEFRFSKIPMLGFPGSALLKEAQLPCQKPLPVLFQELSSGYTGSKNYLKKGYIRSFIMPKRCFDFSGVLY